MSKKLTIEVDDQAYDALEQFTARHGARLEDAASEAIRDYVESRINYERDPFFQLGEGGSSGLGDLSEHHDRYLYGS